MTRHPLALICRTLGIGRATAYRATGPRPVFYQRREDRLVTAQIRTIIRTRGSYGSRRVRALVNHLFGTGYNRKRIRRLLRMHGWILARPLRRRTGRAHRGQVVRPASNERWCSDAFEVVCWSGEVVQVAFALDCHDREVLAWIATDRDLVSADIRQLMGRAVQQRFGSDRAPVPIQWLSDNGSIYTALETQIAAERLQLVPITTPAYSPESNGMAEALVATLRRDYLSDGDLSSAASVFAQLEQWFGDYNALAPHSALGFKSPRQYRALLGGVVYPKSVS
jgi:transposase InsO family protein